MCIKPFKIKRKTALFYLGKFKISKVDRNNATFKQDAISKKTQNRIHIKVCKQKNSKSSPNKTKLKKFITAKKRMRIILEHLANLEFFSISFIFNIQTIFP